jgi:hypothetical protein
LLRGAAEDRLPVDAGRVGQLHHLIRRAYELGEDQGVLELRAGHYERAAEFAAAAERAAMRLREHERGQAMATVALTHATLALTGFRSLWGG